MLRFRRQLEVANLGAYREARYLLHPRLRVYRVTSRGVEVEQRLCVGTVLPLSLERPSLQLVLRGAFRTRTPSGDVWLGPGELIFGRDASYDERWCGDPFEMLVIEGDEAMFTACSDELGRLPPPELARIAALVGRAFNSDGDEPPAAVVQRLMMALASIGLPVRRPTRATLDEPVSPMLSRAADALAQSYSDLRGRPMMIDLEQRLGVSRRHALRLMHTLARRYRVVDGNWRDSIARWRVRSALTLLSAPGATTDAVARAVGFSSPTVLCRALRRRGLDSPRELRARIRILA